MITHTHTKEGGRETDRVGRERARERERGEAYCVTTPRMLVHIY